MDIFLLNYLGFEFYYSENQWIIYLP